VHQINDLSAHRSNDYGTATDKAGNNPFETIVSKDFLVSPGNDFTPFKHLFV